MRQTFIGLVLAVLLCGCAMRGHERETVREVWEYGDRKNTVGYMKQGAKPFVAWSQIVFYDNLTYRHTFYVKTYGFKCKEHVVTGKWSGNDSEAVAETRSKDCSIPKHLRVFASAKEQDGQQPPPGDSLEAAPEE